MKKLFKKLVHFLWYDIFGRYFGMILQYSYWFKTVLFLLVESHNKFSSQNIVTSSQNNIRKYRTKAHEQVSSFNSSLL